MQSASSLSEESVNSAKKLPPPTSPLHRMIKYVPLVNFVYDMALCGEPTVSDIKELLNTLGLMSALMLTSVVSFPTSLEAEEITAANERLADCWYKDAQPAQYSDRLMMSILYSSLSLACVCIIMVELYLSMASGNFCHMEDEHQQQKFDIWYFSLRMLFVIMYILVIVGIVYFFMGMFQLVVIKFPLLEDASCESYVDSAYYPVYQLCIGLTFGQIIPVLWVSWTHYKLLKFEDDSRAAPVTRSPSAQKDDTQSKRDPSAQKDDTQKDDTQSFSAVLQYETQI